MTWLAYSHLGVAKTVQLTTQPAVALAGIPFGVQPVGRLVDGSGVLSRATGVTVTASKASGTGTLSGTLSVQTVEGVFTFTDLKMDTVTSAVTLSFASSGLTSATSSAFNVTQPNTIIGCEVGTYAVTGTAQTLTRGPYLLRPFAPGSYAVTGTAVTLTGPSGVLTDDGFYIYTHEPVDQYTVLAEDFSRAAWYTLTADDASANGGMSQIGVHGWFGTISNGRGVPPNPAYPQPPGAVLALGGGEYMGWTGTVGTAPNTETANMADHTLKVATNEVWLRFYTYHSANYVWGAEKMITFNATTAGNGGISIGGAGSGGGAGAAWTICPYYDCNVTGEVYYYRQNTNLPASLTLPGRWQFVEMHLKMNTPGVSDGIWEMWLDDCGSGTFPVNPSGSPTLKAAHYTVEWQGPTQNNLLRSIWFECWSNPISSGDGHGWYRIMANTNHANGFCTNIPSN